MIHNLHDYLWENHTPTNQFKEAMYITPRALQIFRFIAMLLEITACIWAGFVSEATYVIYMTIWGLTITAIYFTLATYCQASYGDYLGKSTNAVTLSKVTYVLCELAFSLEMVIGIVYWSLLFPYDKDSAHPEWYWLFDAMLHAMTPIMILTENIFNGVKFYKRHALILTVVMVVYGGVNYAATEIRGIPVYPIMTWTSITTLYYMIMSTVMGYLFFAFGYCWSNHKRGKIDHLRGNSDVSNNLLDA